MAPMTRDHSLVNDYLNIMPDMPTEAMEIVPRNVITRALGMEESVLVDIRQEPVQPGDRFLLCTDGLTDMVDEGRIGEILEVQADPQVAAEALVAAANEAGGHDNVTAIVVHWKG